MGRGLKKRMAMVIGLLLMGLVLVVSGCGGGKDTEKGSSSGNTIKIGEGSPFTGPVAQVGEVIKKATELAVEQANSAGGINGKKIEVDYQDDKSDPKEAAIVANKFAADDTILATVSHWNSSCLLAASPILTKAGIPHITFGTSPAITDAGPFTYRAVATDASDGQFVAKWTVDEGFKKIAILWENDDYGKGLGDVYDQKVKSLGASVVFKEPYNLGETKDFSAILTKLKAANPDVLFIAGSYNEAAMIMKQSKRLGINIPVFGSNGLYADALVKVGGESVEGLRLVGSFHPSSDFPESKAFVEAYKAKWGQDPDIWAAFAYDNVNIILSAVKNAGEDRKKINDYLTNLKDFKGATGITTFDQNGDALKEPLKLIVKDGKFEIYKK